MARNVHATLNRRTDLFARVAAGTYGLRDLGYRDVPEIADFLESRIRLAGRPMHRNELVALGEREHGFKARSVSSTLGADERFRLIQDAFYDVRERRADRPARIVME